MKLEEENAKALLEQEKEKKKKKLLYGAIIPFIILIVGSIFIKHENCNFFNDNCSFIDYIETILYSLVFPTIGFFDIFIDLDSVISTILTIVLTLYGYGYPLYYLIDKFSQKKKRKDKENSKTQESSNSMNKILFVIYILSFLVYLSLVYIGIFGTCTGFALFYCNRAYGLSAMLWTFICFCIIPIYPFVIIFQLIYSIKNYKRFPKKYKKITKITIGIIALLLALSAIFPPMVYDEIDRKEAQRTKEDIESYLTNKYGNGNFDYDPKTKEAKTSYMNSTFDADNQGYYYDNFIEVYYKEKENFDHLDDYLESVIENTINDKFNIKIKYSDINIYNLEYNKVYGHIPSIQEMLKDIKLNDLTITINESLNSEEEALEYVERLASFMIKEVYFNDVEKLNFRFEFANLNLTNINEKNGRVVYYEKINIYISNHFYSFDLEELLNK